MDRIVSYRLKKKNSSETVFEAANAKFFLDNSYCVLFQDYPAEETRALVCRKIGLSERLPGVRLCQLVSYGLDNTEKNLGDYVSVAEVGSEREAIERIQSNIRGTAILKKLLK